MVKSVTLRTTRMPWVEMAKAITPPIVWQYIYKKLVIRDISLAEQYKPNYSPWLSRQFMELFQTKVWPHTVVSLPRAWTLWTMLGHALNVPGAVMEAGVFQGGTARLLRERIGSLPDRHLYLFDSFEGMKQVDADRDRHSKGDFSDTGVDQVRQVVGDESFIHYCKGWVPDSFIGLEDLRFCFVHIDLDLYQGVLDTLKFVYPRLSHGGVIVFDDYGFASCPGARKAVDEFFSDKPEKPLALTIAQAVVHKL